MKNKSPNIFSKVKKELEATHTTQAVEWANQQAELQPYILSYVQQTEAKKPHQKREKKNLSSID
jgi:hypothetical protein